MSPGLITTSWDDGHPLDLRLAQHLADCGLVGTFYVPRQGPTEVMTASQIRDVQAMGMEVGAHSLTHRPFTGLGDAEILDELTGGKAWLEDILQSEVPSFCFPSGRHRRSHRRLVAEAGYSYGRTTRAFGFDQRADPLLAPVTLQLFPHSAAIHLRHAVREGNLRGAARWIALGARSDLGRLLERSASFAAEQQGVLHVWGHSWEVDETSMWPWLDTLGELASHFGLAAVTNGALVDAGQPS